MDKIILKCKNCVYYSPNVNYFIESECLKFGKKISTKLGNFYYIKECRYNENKCGKLAKFYRKKD